MTKLKFLLTIMIMVCYSVIQAQTTNSDIPYGSEKINWPELYDPSNSAFYVHNEIEIAASPEIVWDLLIHAENWPEWYEGASEVSVIGPKGGYLTESSVFTWKTMGLKFQSTIREFVPYSRLSWESKKKSIKGYHAWLILPTSNGCKVITDESQYGWLTFFEKIFQPNKLHRLHDIWLEELKTLAEERTEKNSNELTYEKSN